MGSYFRCVYIPMRNLATSEALQAAMAQARLTGECGVMEGLGVEQAWTIYRQKQAEIIEAGRLLCTRFARKRGGCKGGIVQWHGTGGLPLQDIRTHRTYPASLYVHCHGNSEFVGFRPLTLTPAQLVNRLIGDGLQRNGQALRIKLWSCHSGETAEGKTQSYLADVVAELRRHAFYNVEVFGYTGGLNVNGDASGTHKTATIGVQAPVRAKDRRSPLNTGLPPPAPAAAAAAAEDDEDEDEDEGVYVMH